MSSAPKDDAAQGGGPKGPMSAAAKLREQVALDATIQNDPKYRKYAQQVEKCLATFENMHEWPDFIAFLKQLLKTLQSYTQFKEIPRKLIVSKRLSQCLIPALPSGVHQRALDVYSHILSVLGPEGLKRDFPLWSSGLFPFFEYASTSVKPTLLSMFEKYYLPLQSELRAVMRALILALLPGLEEETSDFFERVMGLLDHLSGTVSPAFFFQNIWLIMLTTQVPRAYCLNYLSRRLPRLDATEDITPIVGRDIGLMMRAFAAALGDDNLLVQRGALDLLLQALRADSAAFSQASAADRARLVRAATGVVLRRDLSLNRRLFSWLLGSDEHVERQAEYFRTHALGLLADTLRDEMYHPSSEYSNARPFKIYISLLDKWEIGAPLTEALIYDALKSIKRTVDRSIDVGEDILITANTLYEAMEPRAIWRRLFQSVRKEIIENETQKECIDMMLFVLKTFRVDEDEIQNVHLPLLFCALVEKLEELAKRVPRRITTPTFRAAMDLLEQIAVRTSVVCMMSPLQLANLAFGGSFDDTACAFYGLDADVLSVPVPDDNPHTLGATRERKWMSAVPFIASFEHLADLTVTCVELATGSSDSAVVESADRNSNDAVEIGRGDTETGVRMHAFVQSVSLLLKLTEALNDARFTASETSLTISWNAEGWLDCISQPLNLQSCSFVAADRVVSLAIRLHATSYLQPKPAIDKRPRLLSMMRALMDYLRLETSPYHVRAVRLIWDLEHATTHHHLESIIAQRLVASSATNGYTAYAAFGALWRLSDDDQQPGIHFKVPMLIVLDTLKSTDPVLRRVGETWMRCNLKSYPRVLDPILLELINPAIYRSEGVTTVRGREIRGPMYDRPFDQHRIAYLLDVLLQVVRFGGHNFSRVAASTLLARSPCPQLVERVTQNGFSLLTATYNTVLADTLLRFLQSEPKPSLFTSMQRLNIEAHSSVIDLLQCIVSRGDLDQVMVETLESAVIIKLFSLVHFSRLELQNKLLHLLHSIISSSAAAAEKQRIKSPNMTLQNSMDQTLEAGSDGAQAESTVSASINPLLIQLLVDGVATPTNRPLLHHWLDFILMTIPQFPHILTTAISPLNACICRQIRSELDDISRVLELSHEPTREIVSCADDAEFVMLFNALERLILLSLDELDSNMSDENSPTDRSASDGAGLLSMVSNVFLTDSANQATEAVMTARSPAYRSLHEGVGVLYATWNLVSEAPATSHPAYETLAHIFTRTSSRCRKVFDKLYRVHAFEVIESVIEYWNVDQSALKPGKVAFDIVDFLTASAQNVVHMVCESISWRISPTAGERSRKQVLNPELTDAILFMFLEEYLLKLEHPLALQVWPRYLSLAKDVAANVKEYRSQMLPVLRCTTILALKITQTTAIEDRKTRKDIQDTYGKLLDAVSLDQGIWPRRTKENLLVNGKDVALSRTQSESNLNEKYNGSPVPVAESSQKSPVLDLSDKINQYLAYDVLPNLRRFLIENDKILAACNNILYYVVSPALKTRTNRLADVDDIFIAIVDQMSKLSAAVKAWRNPAIDVFNDIKFFSATPISGLKWRSIIKTLIDTDKTAFSELLGRIASAPSANIFVNREYEMQTKAQNIRRLSFVLFASEKNHFLTQLPAVQEKLVDILRSGSSSIVESEVYLCIRVLLCRLSPHNLSSFWPVLLSELIRIFEQVMAEPPSDGSDSLQSILSACKLIDLLLVLQTEEFQIHQWIFITDTVDAIYRPDNWFPEAIMDQLSETVGDLPSSESVRISLPDATSPRGMRQPLLKSAKQIDSIH
ncbi:Dopey, N-terminal-domain-containing protein [Phellopilus nigrolimitatus]|nr:Dopey, N-terminal-domain-containing protein [Phellopilus nigrolimitatus]